MSSFLGYLCAVLIIASFAMKRVLWLRLIQQLGVVVGIWYGVLIGELPIILLNSAILFINGYRLFQLLWERIKYERRK